MISIRLSKISLILGAHPILQNLDWTIQDNQKIGLIGANGAGKSSLFKLIQGEYAPEPGGVMTRGKGITVGYLPQVPEIAPGQTAFQAAMNGNPRWLETNQRLEAIEADLGKPEVYNNDKALTRILEEQQRCLEDYQTLGGESYPEVVRSVLCGLGLARRELDKPTQVLSGGQKKLVGLACLLLAQPPVLLLDEPDNHLDLAGKMFLEKMIQDYPGAVVLVSHDRYLLDAVVTHIDELEDGKITSFAGDYTSYISDKEQRLARAEELWQVQQREINRLEMARKRYALWVQLNDKFASRMRAIETRIERMEKLDRPILERRRMGLNFQGWRGSTKVLELEDVSKSFQTQEVLKGISILLKHGERVGLIGANGAGKSVLLRLILGLEEPDAGEVKIGPSVTLGYYAQEHETLDLESTLIDTVRRAKAFSEGQAVAFLSRFLFPYRQANQKIKLLSGGERSRLQLALLVLSGPNFLLLDEPTNNLDIASAEVLESALEEFEGTVLVISHDRYFLDRTVNRILLLENGVIQEYSGSYSDYWAKSQ